MKNATINVKTEGSLKRQAQAFARNSGMSLSDLVNQSLRQTFRQGRLIIEPLVPNAKTARELRKSLKNIKQAKNLSKAFGSSREMDDHLDSL